MAWESQPERVRVPYVQVERLREYLSTAEHEKFSGKLGRPLPKAKYTIRPIVQ